MKFYVKSQVFLEDASENSSKSGKSQRVKGSFFSFEKKLLRHSWLLAFMIVCYIGYERGVKRLSSDFEMLNQRLTELESQKKEALDLQKSYLLQINSQHDPAWLELTLMRVLGLVPEGQTKVYFSEDG